MHGLAPNPKLSQCLDLTDWIGHLFIWINASLCKMAIWWCLRARQRIRQLLSLSLLLDVVDDMSPVSSSSDESDVEMKTTSQTKETCTELPKEYNEDFNKISEIKNALKTDPTPKPTNGMIDEEIDVCGVSGDEKEQGEAMDVTEDVDEDKNYDKDSNHKMMTENLRVTKQQNLSEDMQKKTNAVDMPVNPKEDTQNKSNAVDMPVNPKEDIQKKSNDVEIPVNNSEDTRNKSNNVDMQTNSDDVEMLENTSEEIQKITNDGEMSVNASEETQKKINDVAMQKQENTQEDIQKTPNDVDMQENTSEDIPMKNKDVDDIQNAQNSMQKKSTVPVDKEKEILTIKENVEEVSQQKEVTNKTKLKTFALNKTINVSTYKDTEVNDKISVDSDDDVKIIENGESKFPPQPASKELLNEMQKVAPKKRTVVCEKRVFSFGYAPMLVLQKFQEHCKKYNNLTNAIHALLARDSLLRNKYRYINTNTKYQLMVCATNSDKDFNLKPAIEALRMYTRNNQFRTLAHAIEELLLSPIHANFTPPVRQAKPVPIIIPEDDHPPSEYTEINKNEQKALEKIASAVYQTLLSHPKFKPKRSRSRTGNKNRSPIKKPAHSYTHIKLPVQQSMTDPPTASAFNTRMLLFPQMKVKNCFQSDVICLKELQASVNDLKDRVLKSHESTPMYTPDSEKEKYLYKLSLQSR